MRMFFLALFFASSATAAGLTDKPIQPFDPAKPVTVTLPLQDWQAVVSSIGDSARVSARDASRINQNIASQVNQQLAPSVPPAKK